MPRYFLFATALSVLPLPAPAQNLAPELMIEGSCDELVAWGSRPAEEVRADLDERLGTEVEAKMPESMYKTMIGVLENTPVSDSWFARPCTFTEAQLAAMAPLHEAYVSHMAAKLAPK